MKRIVYWLLSTVTVVVLLFGYRTSLAGPLAGQGKTVASSPPPAPASGSTTAGTASRTVTGPVVQTQWGPVQVQVKVNGGKLADVSVVQSPNGNPRDQEINAYALPILVQESLDAQSARPGSGRLGPGHGRAPRGRCGVQHLPAGLLRLPARPGRDRPGSLSSRAGRGAGPGRAGRAAVPGRVPGPPGRARRRGRARPHRGGEGLGGRTAADHLRALEATDFCLSAGGDMVCRTLDPDAPPWRIGIEDPHHTDRLVAVAPVHTGAVATSGTAHRGDHLVDARTGRPPAGVASVTVVAASLTWADIDATAAYAHGRNAARWLRTRPGRSGLVVWSDGSTTLVDGPGARPGVTGGP